MKFLNNFFSKADRVIEEKSASWKRFFKKFFVIFSTVLFVSLVALFVWKNFRSRPYLTAALINKDISRILDSLSKIDRDCSILEIENDKNVIDFLSVEKFAGSEVGCLNLAYPNNWKGPYLKRNPVLQGKPYEIVKTKDGIFIVPGDGVYLPNGLTIGKDFKIDKDSSILEMLKRGGNLNFDGKPLTVKIDFVIGDWDTNFKTKQEKYTYWQKMINEFNAAMPFTMRKRSSIAC